MSDDSNSRGSSSSSGRDNAPPEAMATQSAQSTRQRLIGNPYVFRASPPPPPPPIPIADASTASLHRLGGNNANGDQAYHLPMYYEPEARLQGYMQPQMIINGARQAGQQDQEPAGQAGPAAPPTNNDSLGSLLNNLVRTNPETSVIVKNLEKYIPFGLIILAKGFFDHATGILVFLGLFVTFYHGNSVLTREISRQSRRNSWPLLAVLVNLTACYIFIYFVFNDSRLFTLSLFLPLTVGVESFTDLLWVVAINDFMLKFLSVIIKILVVLCPASVLAHKKRGNCFLFVEMSSQLHRSLVPIQVWLVYLLQGGLLPGTSAVSPPPSSEGSNVSSLSYLSTLVGMILMIMYMVVKGKLVLSHAVNWKSAASRLWQSTRYGTCPSAEEVKASGGQCPICHDNLVEPSMLHCKHIFCEECVTTWFDREQTCPMCRAQVTDDPSWRDGATSMFIQLF